MAENHWTNYCKKISSGKTWKDCFSYIDLSGTKTSGYSKYRVEIEEIPEMKYNVL